MLGVVQRIEMAPLGSVAWLNVSRETANDWPLTVRTGPLGLKITPLPNSHDAFYFRGARIRAMRCVLSAATVNGAELRRSARVEPVESENTAQILIRVAGPGSVFDARASFAGAELQVIRSGREIRADFETNSHICTLNVQQSALGIEPDALATMTDGIYTVTAMQAQLLRSAVALLVPGADDAPLPSVVAAVDRYLASLATLLLRTAVRGTAIGEHARLGSVRSRTEAIIFAQAADPLLTPASIAAQLNISLRQLYRAFDGVQSPAARIRDRRLAQAAELLGSHLSSAHVENVAQQCGFVSAEYFSRVFRREYGLSPRAYRAAQRDIVVSR
jgi:AraC-like DNA-binding protein